MNQDIKKLDRLIIHLKNLIFLKVILYSFIIILLINITKSFNRKLSTTIDKQHHYQTYHDNAQYKLNIIEDVVQNIDIINHEFKESLIAHDMLSNIYQATLSAELDLLTKKYGLPEPISMKIIKLFSTNSSGDYTQNKVRLKNHQLLLNFSIMDYKDYIPIIHDIINILPAGAMITKSTIQRIEALSPNIVSKISTENIVGLLNVKMTIIIREIIYAG